MICTSSEASGSGTTRASKKLPKISRVNAITAGRYRSTPRRSAVASTSSEIAGLGGTAKTPGSTPRSSWFALIVLLLPGCSLEHTRAGAGRQVRDGKLVQLKRSRFRLTIRKRNKFRSTNPISPPLCPNSSWPSIKEPPRAGRSSSIMPDRSSPPPNRNFRRSCRPRASWNTTPRRSGRRNCKRPARPWPRRRSRAAIWRR